MPALSRANRKVASGESQFVPVPRLSSETSFEPIAEGVTNRMSDPYRRCPHCRGTGICSCARGRADGAAKRKTVHVLFSARKWKMSELPRFWRI